ncbi:hypothetical protein [Salirhabdus salicampi]|uniref:hypothetical protein n=1 Tax=Salirhabdus salicampi TaxID=476102 RepID=UPI0020C2C08B|nr:hypothetical protein [Salirhabdus salicampi]MCP8617929.1 hypothetical protein [Salirhabdus salicampi]
MKTLFTVFLLIVLTFSPSRLFAESDINFFEVNSAIENVHNRYIVQTKGEKPLEGAVFTVKDIKQGVPVTVSLEVKGEGHIYIRTEETDRRGKFLQQQTSKRLTLSDEWQRIRFPVTFSMDAQLIDVLIVTSYKQKTEFQFKNVKVLSQ